MNVFVLIGHQKPGSFCHAIAATAIEELKSAGHEVVYHDLYAERFDPILPHEEIPKDAPLDPVVEQHCREVTAADGYLIVHPNWWAMPPAILKGWLDRVLRQGVAYQFGPGGVEPLLGRQSGGRVHHLEHAPRRRIAAVRRPAGKPVEDVRVQLLRRRRFLPPQLRVDHHEHARAAQRVARRSPHSHSPPLPGLNRFFTTRADILSAREMLASGADGSVCPTEHVVVD